MNISCAKEKKVRLPVILLALAAVLTMVMLLSGGKANIIGTWKCTGGTGDYGTYGKGDTYTFNEDNTYKNVYKALEGESITEGTWKVQGKKLTMIANNSEDDGEELATTLTCDIEKLTRKNLSLSYSESGTDDDGEEFSAIIKLTYKRTK